MTTDRSPGMNDSGGMDPPDCKTIKELAADVPMYQDAHDMAAVWQPIIVAVGIVGNILIVIVMAQRSYRRNSCANYIATLAISDTIALLRKSVDLFQIARGTTYSHASCGAWVYLALAACQMSTFLVVCMTIDRLILVRFPRRAVTYCKPRTARIVMAICLVVVIIFNIPHIVMTGPVGENKYCASFTSKKWQSLALPYGILQGVVNFVIPSISLVIMTVLIIVALRKNRKRHDKLSEKITELRSSLSNNIITNISTDGLFHYVISYAAYTLFEKRIGKKMNSLNKDKQDSEVKEKNSVLDGSVNEAFDPDNGEENKEGKSDENCEAEQREEREKCTNPEIDPTMVEEERIKENIRLGKNEMEDQPNCVLSNKETEDESTRSDHDDSLATNVNLSDKLRRKSEDRKEKMESWVDESCQNDPNITGNTTITSPIKTAELTPINHQQYRRQESKGRKKKDGQLSFLLLLVVFFFLILTSSQYIRYLLFIGKLVDPCKDKHSYALYFLIYSISNKLYFTNCAINFFLYLFGSSLFRFNLKELFVGVFRWCRKQKTQVSERSETWDMGREMSTQTGGRELQTVSTQTVPAAGATFNLDDILDSLPQSNV